MKYCVRSIGIVCNGVRQSPQQGWQQIVSDIVIEQRLAEALNGLEQFSNITVIYWLHQAANEPVPTKIHPRGKTELPLVGLFATRSPHRPNAIGMTTVKLLGCQRNVLKVEGLDAFDGTPVIDIKPYIPRHDTVTDAKVPPWMTRQ